LYFLAKKIIKPYNCYPRRRHSCALLLPFDWVVVLRPTRHRIRHFRDILHSQSLGLVVLRKLNPTQQKQHRIKLIYANIKTHIMLNLKKHKKMKSDPKPTCKFKNCSRVYVYHCPKLSQLRIVWYFSLLASRQSPQLWCCLLEGRGY